MKTAILSVVVALWVSQTVLASVGPTQRANARMHGYESRALNSVVQKGGVTSGGGDYSPIRECVNNFSQVGTIQDPEQLFCTGVSTEEKLCITQGLNAAYDLDEIVQSCSSVR